MAFILHIETSTEICSAAISNDNGIVASKEHFIERSHAAILTSLIEEVIAQSNIDFADLNAVAVSKGPGSYTGLRIGVSTAKGICYALNIPLIAVDTLLIIAEMANAFTENITENTLFLPMIDARRMEVYTAVYNHHLDQKSPVSATIIDADTFVHFTPNQHLVFCGNGAEKCKEFVSHANAIFLTELYPSAKYMHNSAMQKYNSAEFENVAYFEPYYLKDFIATVPKNKVLGTFK
jgi:tRNA threonylcarbamoyladenosine biosynthesis protein TsaB